MTKLTLKSELSDALKEKLAKLAGKQDENGNLDNSENKEARVPLKPTGYHHYSSGTYNHKTKNKGNNQQQQQPKKAKEPKPPKPQQPKKKKGRSDEEVAILLQQQQAESQKILQQAKDWLVATYPKGFDWDNPKPLAIGTHNKVDFSTCPVGIRQQKKLLTTYVSMESYHAAVVSTPLRYDLEGNHVEAITPEQKQYAMKKLAQLKEKQKAEEQARLEAAEKVKLATEQSALQVEPKVM